VGTLRGPNFVYNTIASRQFLPAPPQFCKFRNWPSQFRNLGVCYGFINPEVNHVAFWMRGCSRSKVCINYWFSDCWIQKPNFYYGLMDPEWFFSIMDFWIHNAYFELRWFFQLWMFCILFIFINTIIHVLSEASIRENTGCANPKIYRIS